MFRLVHFVQPGEETQMLAIRSQQAALYAALARPDQTRGRAQKAYHISDSRALGCFDPTGSSVAESSTATPAQ
ncbi:MAG: hypothetical protein ABSB61_09480 [Anaerolineales bacterium]|jgi:hypothetical protein